MTLSADENMSILEFVKRKILEEKDNSLDR